MSDLKFKPCPFCGGPAGYNTCGTFDGWSGKVYCSAFCVVSPSYGTGVSKSITHVEEELQTVWNRRKEYG